MECLEHSATQKTMHGLLSDTIIAQKFGQLSRRFHAESSKCNLRFGPHSRRGSASPASVGIAQLVRGLAWVSPPPSGCSALAYCCILLHIVVYYGWRGAVPRPCASYIILGVSAVAYSSKRFQSAGRSHQFVRRAGRVVLGSGSSWCWVQGAVCGKRVRGTAYISPWVRGSHPSLLYSPVRLRLVSIRGAH